MGWVDNRVYKKFLKVGRRAYKIRHSGALTRQELPSSGFLDVPPGHPLVIARDHAALWPQIKIDMAEWGRGAEGVFYVELHADVLEEAIFRETMGNKYGQLQADEAWQILLEERRESGR
jgi:hypothetical protein